MRLLLFLFALLLTASALQAQTIRQRSTTSGFNVGLQGHLLGWSSDYFRFLDENAGSGGGVTLRMGYGFTQHLEAFGQFDRTGMNVGQLDAASFRFSHLTGGVRYNISATTHAFRPFLELGYAHRSAMVRQVVNGNGYNDINFRGGAVHLGGGLNYFVALPVALSLSGSFQTGGKAAVSVDSFDTGDRADVSTFRVSLGVILFPGEF